MFACFSEGVNFNHTGQKFFRKFCEVFACCMVFWHSDTFRKGGLIVKELNTLKGRCQIRLAYQQVITS